MSLLSVLFDNLQGLTVCEYSYEYQEYNTLDELHHLCGKAHHRQTTVQDDVQTVSYTHLAAGRLAGAPVLAAFPVLALPAGRLPLCTLFCGR